jgi:hypothetical protein
MPLGANDCCLNDFSSAIALRGLAGWQNPHQTINFRGITNRSADSTRLIHSINNDLDSFAYFFGKAFTDSLESLANSLKPQIGTGYIVCLASSVIGLGILLYLWRTDFRSKSSKPENEN